MNTAIRAAAVAFAIAFAGAQAVRPERTNPASDPDASLLRHAPAQVSAMFERACRDCHSNETTWPWYSNVAPASWLVVGDVNDARSYFNYSTWATYSADDQDQLLGAMCSLVKRGRMPLPSYRLMHRQAQVSQAEAAALCTWTDRMRDTLE